MGWALAAALRVIATRTATGAASLYVSKKEIPMRSASKSMLALAAGMALLASGCGGGGGSDAAGTTTPATTTTTTTTTAPAVLAAQLTGTAATGAALANAPVSITNAAGNSPCVESVITTSALGAYTCTLKSGEVAPFFIVVTDPTGDKPPMVSVSTTTPAAGSALTMNVTPLTTAIVSQLVSPADALAVVNSRTVNATQLATITSNVVAQLAPVLAAIGAPAGYDPFSTAITAATAGNTGNTADLVLDVVKVTTDPATGAPALMTIDGQTPILLASATTPATPLAAPDASVSTLSAAAQIAARTFNGCFALPTATRVTGTDTTIAGVNGGPSITGADAACQDIVADTGNAAGMDFLHNGYEGGQFFYGLMTSDAMTGAQFSVPEVIAYYPASASGTGLATKDRAILNFRFVDANGDPGNFITVAARIPNSSSATRATEWWLTGNQQGVDTSVKLVIRRTEQFKAGATSNLSTFQSGAQFLINPNGPGSVRGGQRVKYARVTGPGLPVGGVTYIAPVSTTQQWMDLFNKDGSALTTGSQCGNAGSTTNCPNIWFEQTAGLTGSSATTLAPNPSTGLVNKMLWVQTTDVGFDPSLFVRPAQYKFELFYGANTGTPDVVVTKTLLSDLVRATQGVNLPWNTPGAQLLAALDPAGSLAGAQPSLLVDWTQNIAAQQIGSALPVIAGGSFGSQTRVPRGATSVTLSTDPIPAFNTTTGSRGALLGYRMLDGTSKSAVYRYN
jgi:hypothetical protein